MGTRSIRIRRGSTDDPPVDAGQIQIDQPGLGVSPGEGVPDDRPRLGPVVGVGLAAAAVFLFGGVLFGQITTQRGNPDNEVFGASRATVAPSLEWTRVASLDTNRLHAVAALDGGLVAFGSDPSAPGVESGLHAWTSSDGVEWEARGEVLGDDYEVQMVAAGHGAAIAVAVAAKPYRIEPAGRGSDALVFVTTDGLTWDGPTAFGRLGTRPIAAAVGDGFATVAVEVVQDLEPAMWQGVGAEWREVLAAYPDRIHLSIEDTWIRVRGPGGLPLGSWSAHELGANGTTHVVDVDVWSTTDFRTWEQVENLTPGAVVDMVGTADGAVVALGERGGRSTLWSTADGFGWTEATAPSGVGVVAVRSGATFVAGANDSAVSTAAATGTWSNRVEGVEVPAGAGVVSIAAHDLGVFAVVDDSTWRTQRPVVTATSTDGETTYRIHEGGTTVFITDLVSDGRAPRAALVDGITPHDGVTFDPGTGTIVLGSESTTGDATFVAHLDDFGPTNPRLVPEQTPQLLFSPDGWTWHSGATAGNLRAAVVELLLVTDRVVVMSVQKLDAPTILDRSGGIVESISPVEMWIGVPQGGWGPATSDAVTGS